MDPVWYIVLPVAIALPLWLMVSPSLQREVRKAVANNDMTPVVQAISKKRASAQPGAYNKAIRMLWTSYDREQAVPLIKELARNFGTTMIAQYWLDQLLKVEPKLAKEKLEPEFVQAYYQPDLAAKCGKAG